MDCGSRLSPTCSQRLAAVRLLYLGLQVHRLEAIAVNVDVKCLSGAGLAALVLGMVLGLGSHIASIALLAHEHAPAASTGRPSRARWRWTDTVVRGPALWLQPLVVPFSMAGLALELLSGAPSAALVHGRVLAVVLLLSITVQRDPLWEALPQLAAALALDFAAFVAAALTGRYETPQDVVQHLLSTTAAAVAAVGLTPLYNSLAPRLPPSPVAADIIDPAALEKPLVGLPQGVFQREESRLLTAYRRKISCERLTSALLVLAGVAWGPAAPALAPAASVVSAAAATAGPLSPFLRARAAAAVLAVVTSSTLLLLNGLMAQLPGPLFGEHAGPINSMVTALHALGQVAHVLAFAPRQRSRALMVRMMTVLTANLVGNEDPWVVFLVQLLALLGLVTALDAWLWWGAATSGAAASASAWGGGSGLWFGQLAGQGGGDVAEPVAGGGAAVGAQGSPLSWLLPGRQARVSSSLAGRCAAATAASTGGGGGGSVLGRWAAGSLMPVLCYAFIAATGAAVCRCFATGKRLRYYRLYRRFYLPASYGGACVTAPVPYDEVLQLRDGCAATTATDRVATGAGAAPFDSESSSSTAMVIHSPRRQPSTDASNRSLASRDSGRQRATTRRSVSLNTFVGVGPLGGRGAPSVSSGTGLSLKTGASAMSTMSSMASERAAAAAGLKPADGAEAGLSQKAAASPFSAVAALALELKTLTRGSGGGGAAGAAAVGSSSGDVAHGAAAAAIVAAPAVAAGGGGGDGATGGLDGPRSFKVSGLDLDLDEADVISGKINVTKQLNKLAALGGGGLMGTRDLDRFVESSDSTNGIGNSAAHTGGGGMAGMGFGAAAGAGPGPGHGPGRGHNHHHHTRNAPPRRSSDISYMYSSTAKPRPVVRPTLSGPPAEAFAAAGVVAGGASAVGAGSFLESVAASLASEDVAASGSGDTGVGGGGFELRSGGQHQRVNRLRGAPMRAISDLAAGRRSLYLPASPLHPAMHPQHALQPHQQLHPHQHPHGGPLHHPHVGGGLLQHRLPRRSPSDVTYLGAPHQRGTRSLAGQPGAQPPPPAASSRYGAGTLLSPPGQRISAMGSGTGGGAAPTAGWAAHQAHTAAAAALGVPGAGFHGAGGGIGGLRAASFNAAMSPGPAAAAGGRGHVPERRGPSRQPSWQYTGMIDSTGLMLLGQNLITIGGSSGGPGHIHSNIVILSSIQSPNVSGMNAVSGVNVAAPPDPASAATAASAASAAAAAAALSCESALAREAMSLLDEHGDGIDGDSFGTVSSLEPVRGLRTHRGVQGSSSGAVAGAGSVAAATTAAGGSSIASRAAAVAWAVTGAGPETAAAAGSNTQKASAAAQFGAASCGDGAAANAPAAAAAAEAEATAHKQVTEEDGDAGRGTSQTSPRVQPSTQPRPSGTQVPGPSPPWQQQPRHQPQSQHQHHHHQQQQQQHQPKLHHEQNRALPLLEWEPPQQPAQSHALGRSETEPQLGASVSFRQLAFQGGSWLPSGTPPGAGGVAAAAASTASGPGPSSIPSVAVADASSTRSKMRVSWSDMEARGSGGSTGTNTLLNTASETSKVSTAGTDPAGGSGGSDAAAPAAAPAAAAVASTAQQGGTGGAVSVAEPSRSPPLSSVHPALPQPSRQRPRPLRLGPSAQASHFEMYEGGTQSGGGAIAHGGHSPFDGAAGSGEMSDTSMVVEMEQMRAARELAAMWTSSSVGDASSQMAPSTHSSVAAAAAGRLLGPPGAVAAASDGSGVSAARILSAVQEVSELIEPLHAGLVERRGSTRQRRLSQVMSPGLPLAAGGAGAASGGGARPGGRSVHQPYLPHLQLQQRLGSFPSAGTAGGGGHGDSSPPAATALAAAAAAQMSHAGGSVSSVAGAGSTAMSFDNWATADDLAAMLLGPAGAAAGASDLTGPHPSAASSSKRLVGLQPGRPPALQAPLQSTPPSPLAPQQQQQQQAVSAGTPGQATLQQQQQQQQRGGSGAGITAPAPRVPQRPPSILGPGDADGSGRGGAAAATYAARGGAGATGAKISVVVDHIVGASRADPGAAAAAAAYGAALMRAGAAARAPRCATQSQLPSGPSMAVAAATAAQDPYSQSVSQLQVDWDGAERDRDRVMPLRSPSVPNMGRFVARGMHPGSVRRTSSMGKSRLGSMSSASSSTLGFLNTNAGLSASPPPGTAAGLSTGQLQPPQPPPTQPLSSYQHQLHRAVTTAAAAGGGSGSRISTPQLPMRSSTTSQVPDGDGGPGSAFASVSPARWEETDPMDSYAHLPPMRASQAQLALSLPASSLRGSVVGRPGGAVGSTADAFGGGVGAGVMSIARNLAAAGATVSGPAGWALDAQHLPVRRAPFRRTSLDERLFKQVVTARLMSASPAAAAAAAARSRGRRRSVGSPAAPLEYIPSRLSQDGRAATGQAGAAAAAAAVPAPAHHVVAAAATAASGPMAGAAGDRPLVRSRSLGMPEMAMAAASPGPVPAGPADRARLNAPQGPAASPTTENHRSSLAGSVATAVTASSTSLQSFADVALGGVNYF